MVWSKIATSVVRMEGEVGEVGEGSCRGQELEETRSHKWSSHSPTSKAEKLNYSHTPGSMWPHASGSSESEFLSCLQQSPDMRSYQVFDNTMINVFLAKELNFQTLS